MLFILLVCLIAPFSFSIPNCAEEENDVCKRCNEKYSLSQNSCVKCRDDYCLTCYSPFLDSCIKCESGFTVTGNRCGKYCTNLYQCQYCNEDLSKCIFCRNGCSLSNGKCTCASRIVIIVLCVIFSVIILSVVIYCLTKTSTSRKNKIIQLALNANTNQLQMIQNIENQGIILDTNDSGNKKDQKDLNFEKPRQLTILPMTSENITRTQNEDKTMCDYCLVEGSFEKLSCGCYLCSKHHLLKVNEKGNNECPSCHKEVNETYVLKCPICNRTDSSYKALQCSCGLQVCLICFEESQSRNGRICPNCI